MDTFVNLTSNLVSDQQKKML